MVSRLLMTSKSVETLGEVIGGSLWEPRLEIEEDVPTAKPTPSGDGETTIVDQPVSELARILKQPEAKNEFLDISKTIAFCRRLQTLGLLPALMFNLDRSIVNHLGQQTVVELMRLQHEKYYGTPEAAARTRAINKKRMDAYKAKVKLREELMKLKTLTKEQREEQGITDEIERELSEALPPPPIDIAEEYDPEFSFCNRRVWGTRHDEIQDILNGLQRKYLATPQNKLFVEGLTRGIGYHNSGLSRRQRNAVEMLFRMGYLTIVFATETLSLGVNMPCKTTVFLGDNITLTPLTYRQTAGRAGRRGFDVLGHIIFWDIPFAKVRRLTCAQLPVLTGGFPVTPTTVLRTYRMLNGVRRRQAEQMAAALVSSRPAQQKALAQQLAKEREVLEGSLVRLYRVPLFSVSTIDGEPDIQGIARLRIAVRYAFRFAADFLRQSSLLDDTGNCDGLAGLVNSLYEGEPGNLALNSLLLSRCLHRRLINEKRVDAQHPTIAAETILEREKNPAFFLGASTAPFQPLWRVQELLTVFAYCFGWVPVSHNVALRMQYKKQYDPLLPSLPHDIWSVFAKQDALLLKTAAAYVQVVSQTYKAADELRLPLSQTDFAAVSVPTEPGSTIATELKKMTIMSRARSPFAAICGRTDSEFHGAAELFNSKPYSIHLDSSLVPQVTSRCINMRNQARPLLSNYALSFLTSVNLKHTAHAASISPNVLYFALRDFHERLYYAEVYTTAGVQSPTDNAADVFVATLHDARRILEWQINKVAA